jgi:hypothetical protein
MKNIIKVLILTLPVILGGCAEPDYPEPIPSVTTQSSRVLSFHAIYNEAGVDIQLDNNNVINTKTENNVIVKSPLLYGKSSGYLTIPAGPGRLLRYRETADSTLLLTDRYTSVASTNATTLLYQNFVRSGNVVVDTTNTLLRISDDLTAPEYGTAKVRFLNIALNSSLEAVIRVTDASANPAPTNSTAFFITTSTVLPIPAPVTSTDPNDPALPTSAPLQRTRKFNETSRTVPIKGNLRNSFSMTGFSVFNLPLSNGNQADTQFNVEVIKNDASGTVIVPAKNINLRGGKIYTLVLVGTDAVTYDLLVITHN